MCLVTIDFNYVLVISLEKKKNYSKYLRNNIILIMVHRYLFISELSLQSMENNHNFLRNHLIIFIIDTLMFMKIVF